MMSPKTVIFSIILLSLVSCIKAQTKENCLLQDGRRCQQTCVKNAENVTTCICNKSYEVQTDGISCRLIIEVDAVFPTFGPASGGTLVTIKGRNLLKDPGGYVQIGTDVVCNIMPYSTNSSIFIYTPNIYNIRSSPLRQLSLSVFHPNSGLESKSPVGFTYMPDPSVNSIKPLSSISSGGIQLTISGENMMSVAEPKLNIYAVAHFRHLKTFTSDCTLSTNTTFFCPSPNLGEVYDLLSNASLSRDDIKFYPGLTLDGVTAYDYNGVYIQREDRPTYMCSLTTTTPYPRPTVPIAFPTDERWNPGLPGPPGPGGYPGPPGPPDWDYPSEKPVGPSWTMVPPGPPPETTTLWYPMDCPVCGTFIVFPNPTIYILKPEELRFRPYSPFNNKYITIKGQDLNRGLTKYDYSIFIGASRCTDVTLTSTQLICSVLDGKPSKQEDSDNILILVQIGVSESNKFYVGKFIYEESLWYYKPAKSGFIALIAFVPILAMAIFVITKLVKKSKQDRRRNWFITATQKQQVAKPGGMGKHNLHPIQDISSGMEQNHSPGGFEENYLHPQKTNSSSSAFEEHYLHPQNSNEVDNEYLHPTTGSAPA